MNRLIARRFPGQRADGRWCRQRDATGCTGAGAGRRRHRNRRRIARLASRTLWRHAGANYANPAGASPARADGILGPYGRRRANGTVGLAIAVRV